MSTTYVRSDHTVIRRGTYEARVCEEPDGRWQVTLRCWDTREEAECQAEGFLRGVAGPNAAREGAEFGEMNPGPDD